MKLKRDLLSVCLERGNPTLNFSGLVLDAKPTGKSGMSPGELGGPSVQGLNV